MWIRMLGSVFVLAVLVAVVSGAAVAIFSDTRTTKGEITSATAATIRLYICESGGTVGGTDYIPGPDCAFDDAIDGDFAGEVIFQFDEELLTGIQDRVTWDLRLVNDGSASWELQGIQYTPTETADPGDDCGTTPQADVTILGKEGDDTNDNHALRVSANFTLGRIRPEGGSVHRVHVEPGEYEDMRVSISLDHSTPNECQGNAWDVVFGWTVSEH